jgi:hypothetical protein
VDQPTYLPPGDPQLALGFDGLTDDQKEFWSERAAIREFCGGQQRGDAEQAAWHDTVRHFDLAA